jgi:hypothetical protein
MKINNFCKEYTHGKVYFKDIIDEVQEFFEELVKFDWEGMKDEFADVIAFSQMWLWNKYMINGKLWKLGQRSFNKFISRRRVWEKLYVYVGIKEKCTYCRNYMRKNKVIKHLAKFNVSEKKALQAYESIVSKQ